MSDQKAAAEPAREPVLSPVDRVSELLFGLFMALTFVGAISVAESGREEVRSMLAAALGCNLAWGLVDAVMYLVRTVTDRGRSLTLVRSVRAAADAAAGRRLIEQSLSPAAAGLVAEAEIEAIRGRIAHAADGAGAAVAEVGRPARRPRRLPARGRLDLSGGAAVRAVRRCRHGEERLPRGRVDDAVPRRPRARPVCGLRQLEGRLHDGRPRRSAGGRESWRSADDGCAAPDRRVGDG